MNAMFQLCGELKFLDFTNFDTSKVTNMKKTFNKCYKLKKIKGLKNFITKNVIICMDYLINALN